MKYNWEHLASLQKTHYNTPEHPILYIALILWKVCSKPNNSTKFTIVVQNMWLENWMKLEVCRSFPHLCTTKTFGTSNMNDGLRQNYEMHEVTKELITSHKSKSRQYIGWKKKTKGQTDKRTNNYLKNTTQKANNWATRTLYKQVLKNGKRVSIALICNKKKCSTYLLYLFHSVRSNQRQARIGTTCLT